MLPYFSLGYSMYSCIGACPSLPPIDAGNVVSLGPVLAVGVYVSVILSWPDCFSFCPWLREILLVHSVQSLSVAQEAAEVSGNGWVWW